MPKIEVFEDALYRYSGRTFENDAELEKMLETAKAELDGRDEKEGILKIELNDTNRPDLWSTAGLGRQLRTAEGGDIPVYSFFSDEKTAKDTGERRLSVDPELSNIRPYITAFVVTGKPIDEAMLNDLIQTQEKLCWNYGRKRKSIAMGVYRNDLIRYPVQYKAVSPEDVEFVPLGMEKRLNLTEILTEHPKGREFGYIVDEYDMAPLITDAEGGVLSFPPIINSARIGAVETGDENLFIELTGTDLPSLLIATSIVACDLCDAGHTVLPVKIEYPYDTPFGSEICVPYYFQKDMTVELSDVVKLLGTEIDMEKAVESLKRMGVNASVEESRLIVRTPEYRNDFLHPVDIAEDIMIGLGMDFFKPEDPPDFTVGRLSEIEQYSRRIKSIMVGLGFQEMIFPYLGSGEDFIEKMAIQDGGLVRIANPMTEGFEYVRNSIIPSLLQAESVSANAVYPHHIFEAGKTACLDSSKNYGTRTDDVLGFLSADSDAGFNLVNSHVSALLYYLSLEYTLEELEDPRFIPGRSAKIICGSAAIGVFGEIHPQVLTNWGIEIPCTACEITLGPLLMEKDE